MGTEQPSQTRPPRRNRLLLHGESVIASAGIALAALLLTLMAGLAWWTVRSERHAAENARVEQVNTVGHLLSHSAEVFLERGELTAVRRLVSETAAKYELTQCRIVLSDSTVIDAYLGAHQGRSLFEEPAS